MREKVSLLQKEKGKAMQMASTVLHMYLLSCSSLSKWPAESFDGEEAYLDIFESEGYPYRFEGDWEKIKLYSEYFSRENRRRAMRDFARLNVYIADRNVLMTQESEDYSQSQLLSDIGGQLGE